MESIELGRIPFIKEDKFAEYYRDHRVVVYQGHALDVLRAMLDGCVQTVITSPPYWGLRDYKLPPMVWGNGRTRTDSDEQCEHEWIKTMPRRNRFTDDVIDEESKQKTNVGAICELPNTDFCSKCGAWRGSLGLEPTPELYVAHIVEVFREVRRVLRDDGTLWLNLGDSYWGGKGQSAHGGTEKQRARFEKNHSLNREYQEIGCFGMTKPGDGKHPIIKAKDLCGIPWWVAFALQEDGWYLRRDIIWSKPNPMPESVNDRPTTAHEYLFLLSKSPRYYYDWKAILEPFQGKDERQWAGSYDDDGSILQGESNAGKKRTKRYRKTPGKNSRVFVDRDPAHLSKRKKFDQSMAGGGSSFPGHSGYFKADGSPICDSDLGRNKRSVWTVATAPYREVHFATFPPALIVPCIKAGAPEGGIVLDPFGGSGTTADVSKRLARRCISIELSEAYCKLHVGRWKNGELEL